MELIFVFPIWLLKILFIDFLFVTQVVRALRIDAFMYNEVFLLTANIHSFSSMERFTSYEYEFMHSNFIVIKIPEYFKSGYYFVNGVGLFRYVDSANAKSYNGKSYDAGIDWNDPIILYNEGGFFYSY